MSAVSRSSKKKRSVPLPTMVVAVLGAILLIGILISILNPAPYGTMNCQEGNGKVFWVKIVRESESGLGDSYVANFDLTTVTSVEAAADPIMKPYIQQLMDEGYIGGIIQADVNSRLNALGNGFYEAVKYGETEAAAKALCWLNKIRGENSTLEKFQSIPDVSSAGFDGRHVIMLFNGLKFTLLPEHLQQAFIGVIKKSHGWELEFVAWDGIGVPPIEAINFVEHLYDAGAIGEPLPNATLFFDLLRQHRQSLAN